jgi:multidrug resistance efflux pump
VDGLPYYCPTRTLTTRPVLEAALAKAEARLQRAVREQSLPGANRDATAEALHKARADCRDARAALTRWERTER